jgi:hypothetical protein
MLDLVINNIFIHFGGRVFQQTIGIPMGWSCTPLHAYEADFPQERPKKIKNYTISLDL